MILQVRGPVWKCNGPLSFSAWVVTFALSLTLSSGPSMAAPMSDTLQLFTIDALGIHPHAARIRVEPVPEGAEDPLSDFVIVPGVPNNPVGGVPRTIALTGGVGTPEAGLVSDTVTFVVAANPAGGVKVTVTMSSLDTGAAPPAGTLSEPEQGFPALDITDLLFATLNPALPRGVNPLPAGFPLQVRVSSCAVDDSPGECPDPTVSVSEPSTWPLFGTSLLGLLGYGWRRKKHSA